MKNNTAKTLPNTTQIIRITMGMTGLALIALIIQFMRKS